MRFTANVIILFAAATIRAHTHPQSALQDSPPAKRQLTHTAQHQPSPPQIGCVDDPTYHESSLYCSDWAITAGNGRPGYYGYKCGDASYSGYSVAQVQLLMISCPVSCIDGVREALCSLLSALEPTALCFGARVCIAALPVTFPPLSADRVCVLPTLLSRPHRSHTCLRFTVAAATATTLAFATACFTFTAAAFAAEPTSIAADPTSATKPTAIAFTASTATIASTSATTETTSIAAAAQASTFTLTTT